MRLNPQPVIPRLIQKGNRMGSIVCRSMWDIRASRISVQRDEKLCIRIKATLPER